MANDKDQLNKLAVATLSTLGRLFRDFEKLKDHVAELRETEQDLGTWLAAMEPWSSDKAAASSALRQAKDRLHEKGGELIMPTFMRIRITEFDKGDLVRMCAIHIDQLNRLRDAADG